MEKSYLEKIQIHKENKLAGLHPGAKLWVVILYTVCTFILNSIHLTEVGLSLAVIPWFLVVLILCATSGAMKKCVKAFKAVAFIALVIFVVQTFIVPGGEVLWRFGILRICEKGLRTAISLSFMVMDIAGIFVWYFQTTSNKEIARALEESGIFYRKNGGKVWTNKSTGSRNRADWSILNRNTHCACILCRFGFCISWWNWNGNSRYSVPGIIKYGIS